MPSLDQVFTPRARVCPPPPRSASRALKLAQRPRRPHDQDKSGWLALINLVPYVGMVVAYVLMLLEGTRGDNRFGPALAG